MRSSGVQAEQVAAGNALHAGRLLSMVENGHQDAQLTLRRLDRGNARVIGVTGPPGAGKSTLVAALIRELRGRGRTVGVLAVDPSSPFSGGALLGDRDRMVQAAAGDPGVFVRSLASRGVSGGLAAAVEDAVRVLDAMGKDVVIVETVGVGQGELAIAKAAHTVVLVLVPGYGDSLQAMKAGINEIADVVVVNKGDQPDAVQAAQELRSQDLRRSYPTGGEDWQVPVLTASALRQEGIDALADALEEHHAFPPAAAWRASAELDRRRARFAAYAVELFRRRFVDPATGRLDDQDLAEPVAAAERLVDDLIEAFPHRPDQAPTRGENKR